MPKTKFQKIIFTAMMVFCMVYCMTVYTIALKFGGLSYQGFTTDWFPQWVQLAAQCFPAALCLQVFFVGPFVRLVFRTIFK